MLYHPQVGQWELGSDGSGVSERYLPSLVDNLVIHFNCWNFPWISGHVWNLKSSRLLLLYLHSLLIFFHFDDINHWEVFTNHWELVRVTMLKIPLLITFTKWNFKLQVKCGFQLLCTPPQGFQMLCTPSHLNARFTVQYLIKTHPDCFVKSLLSLCLPIYHCLG